MGVAVYCWKRTHLSAAPAKTAPQNPNEPLDLTSNWQAAQENQHARTHAHAHTRTRAHSARPMRWEALSGRKGIFPQANCRGRQSAEEVGRGRKREAETGGNVQVIRGVLVDCNPVDLFGSNCEKAEPARGKQENRHSDRAVSGIPVEMLSATAVFTVEREKEDR